MGTWLTEVSKVAPAVSVGVAMVALLLSAGSLFVSRKAYRIARLQEMRRLLPLKVYLVDSIIQSKKGEYQRYGFSLEVSNPAEVANSIARIELWIKCHERNLRHMVRVRCEGEGVVPISLAGGRNHLVAPFKLEAGATVHGWTTFLVHDEDVTWSEIDSYALSIEDAKGVKSDVVVNLMHRVMLPESPEGGVSEESVT